MRRSCEFCGVSFEARSYRARFCSQKHQKRAYRGGKAPEPPPADDDLGAVAASVQSRLGAAGVWDTVSGQAAFKLAVRLDSDADTGSGMAAVASALSLAMDRAIGLEVPTSTPLDELRQRREVRLGKAR